MNYACSMRVFFVFEFNGFIEWEIKFKILFDNFRRNCL